MKNKVTKIESTQLRSLIKEVIKEQSWKEEDETSRPVSFTEQDRAMLSHIYDVVVLGGSKGGYGGGRLRAIPALGSIPD